MNHIITLFLSLLLTVSLGACDSSGFPSASIDAPPSEPTEPTSDGAAATVPYAVGDIILADGSVIQAADLATVDDSNLPIAVVAGFTDSGGALGVGVYRSDSTLQWAPDATTGYTTSFTDIVCTQDAANHFGGDIDGGDNWNVICSDDSQGAADAEKNYPAFSFANTYGETCGLQGDYATGWYMPSVAELSTVYDSREAVNTSLKKIYGLNSSAAMDGLGTNWYWSSSQADSADDYAWFVHYFNGYAGECPKNFTNVHAMAVRVF